MPKVHPTAYFFFGSSEDAEISETGVSPLDRDIVSADICVSFSLLRD